MKLIVYSFLILVISSVGTASHGQSLLFTTKTGATTSGGPGGSFNPQEILVLDSDLGDARHLITGTALNTLIGDGNGDFKLNDFTRNIDAIAVAQSPSPEDTLGLLLSVDQTMQVIGTQVKDGDIFTIETLGRVLILYPEDKFANATQTSSIDIDAFHKESDGTLYFSFANDESTSDPNLVAANGGNAVLDESTVFKLAPGTTTATIAFSRSDILQFVNNAMGASLSTIVDLTGFTADPNNPGDWLFALGSSNSLIEGRIFSTAQNGSLAHLHNQPLDSLRFCFSTEEIIEGIACRPSDSGQFRLFGPETVPSPVGFHSYAVSGGTPHGSVQLFASNSLFPAPQTLTLSGYAGFPFIYVNPSDMLFVNSVSSLDFSRYVDVAGDAVITFATAHLPIGLRITMQAIDLASGTISLPASAGI